MSYSTSNGASRQGNSFLMGLLVGIVLGLAIAGGVAWYIQSAPGHFMNPDKVPEQVMPQVTTPASAVSESKPRFEFYRVLTDKDAAPPAPKGEKSGKPTPATAPAVQEIYFLHNAELICLFFIMKLLVFQTTVLFIRVLLLSYLFHNEVSDREQQNKNGNATQFCSG